MSTGKSSHRFKSDEQRKAVMAKLKGKVHGADKARAYRLYRAPHPTSHMIRDYILIGEKAWSVQSYHTWGDLARRRANIIRRPRGVPSRLSWVRVVLTPKGWAVVELPRKAEHQVSASYVKENAIERL